MKKKPYTKYFIAVFVICFALLMIPGIGEVVEKHAEDKFDDLDKLMYIGYYNMKLEADYAVETLKNVKTKGVISIEKFVEAYEEISLRYDYESIILARVYTMNGDRYQGFYPAVMDDYIRSLYQKSKEFKIMDYNEVERYYDSLLKIFTIWSEMRWPEKTEYANYSFSKDPANFKGKISTICEVVEEEMSRLEM